MGRNLQNCYRRFMFMLAAFCLTATLLVYTKETVLLSSIPVQNPLLRDSLSLVNRRNRTAGREGYDVILSSYMRSGSSFLGQILGHRNDTFYFYEPVWKLQTFRYYGDNGLLCEYKTTDCLNLTQIDNEGNIIQQLWKSWKYREEVRLPQVIQYLQSIYDCDFNYYPEFLQEHIHSDLSLSGDGWRVFLECRQEGDSLQDCLRVQSAVCLRSKRVVSKVLRVSPSNLAELLQNNPRLKIVHLFRDPRSVIHSHLNTEFYHLTENMSADVTKDIDAFCLRLNKDVKSLAHLMRLYPERVKVVRYEDFTDRETFVARVQDLYSFLGVSFSEKDKHTLFCKYYSAKDLKKLKAISAGSYRELSKFDIVQYIDSKCGAASSAIGYNKFMSETELRNVSFRAVTRTMSNILRINDKDVTTSQDTETLTFACDR